MDASAKRLGPTAHAHARVGGLAVLSPHRRTSAPIDAARVSAHPLPSRLPRAGYIGEFELIDDHRSGKIVVELVGRINKCGVISPRYDVQVADIEQWVVSLLPSRQFGKIILTTSMGIMDHDEARRRGTGGKIIGFFY